MLYPNGSTIRPTVSSPFGRRPNVGAFSFHYGADLIGFTTIRAIAAGKVTFAGLLNAAAGYTVIVDHGGGVTSLYMHNDAHHVRKGDRVAEGQAIALMGDSGNATGDCCHLEIRINGTSVEPLGYISARLTNTGGSTAPTLEEEMPIAILERTNSQLAKSLYDVRTGKAIRLISVAENTSFRAGQASGAVVYITVSDKEYKERGGE